MRQQINHQAIDIFAEQYVLEYDRLKKQYPWWSLKTVMQQARAVTVEYLYFCAKEELDIEVLWPEGFKP